MGKAIVLVIIIALVLFGGCVQPSNGGNNLNAEKAAAGDTVSVEYKGTFTDGTVFDSSEGREPLEFIAGAGRMIKGFDAAVIGMELNQEKIVTLQPADAYGEVDQSKIVEIPKENIQNAGELTVGMSLTSPSTGANGIIKEIKENTVIVDFNHPLAGKTLVFWIKIVGIEKA